MKKLAFVIVALAVVLGFLSCKKETVDVKEPLVFSISADIDDDSKAIVTPLGKIEFNAGDHLYPAYKGLNNKSSLIHNTGTCFSGSISLNNEVYDDKTDKGKVPFHFFCLAGVNGGGTTAYWTEVGLSEGCTSTSTCISLQNQGKNIDGTWNDKRRDMPLLCFGQSRENFKGAGTTSFTVDMKNKCALVKYVVEAGIDYDTEIFIVGLNNVVEVDFKVPCYKYMYDNYDHQMENELKNSLAAGYDYDGFKFVKRDGIIQSTCLHTPRSKSPMLDIIIPYRGKPENETDKTYCYSLLLPQIGGLDTLSGYYYDGENQIPLTVAIYDRDDKPVQNIVENKFYKIIVNRASQGNQ